MPSRTQAAASFTCPICLEVGGRKTREHLPLKALYKSSGSKSQDKPAIIRVCERCNNDKSIWDHEILAQYGHILDIDRAKKAQQSIANPSELSDSLKVALSFSRIAARDRNIGDIKYRGIPADTISQWMSYCAPGIYIFFEKTPFRGIGILPIRRVIDHNIDADRFEFPVANHHRINTSCSIELFQRSEEHPKVAIVYLRSPENRLFSFWTILVEDEEQWKVHKQYNPDVADSRLVRVAPARDIFDITKNDDGYSYKGVRKVES